MVGGSRQGRIKACNKHDIYDVCQCRDGTAKVHLKGHQSSSGSLDLLEAKADLIANEDVQFYWSMVSSNWAEETARVLLAMMIDNWIKIRGHSTASAWLEAYKREKKKSVQKSKEVRKQLLSSSTSSSGSFCSAASADS